MEITVGDLLKVWRGANLIYRNEETKMDGVFDYFMQKQNIPILQKEWEKLKDEDQDVLNKIQNETINIPLQRLKPDMLPKNVEKGVVMLLDPIIDGEVNVDGYKSQVGKILQEQKQVDKDAQESDEAREKVINEEENRQKEDPEPAEAEAE